MFFASTIHIGPDVLHLHLVFEALAYTTGFWLYRWLRRAYGDPIPERIRWQVVAAAAIGAVIGSRVLHWLEDPAATIAHWQDLAYWLGGKTIVGGLIGGLLAVEWTKKRIGERRSTGDLFAAPLALGIAVGRIGCFFGGLPDHTYGTPTALPWGIDFGDGVARHPAQLYESVFALVLCALLWRMLARPHRDGDVFKAFMVGYFTWRLVIDAIKPDPFFLGFSSIQWACAAMLLYYGKDVARWMGLLTPAPKRAAGTYGKPMIPASDEPRGGGRV
jgi:phosphatidylglycerol---prolipoprotein diacylglyceryl transferase